MAQFLNQGSRQQHSNRSSAQFVQMTLPCRGRGGYRPGAGRPRNQRSAVRHRKRPPLAARFPVHVTMRVRPGLPSLRSTESHRALVTAIAAAKGRFGCNVVQYSIQSNHVHLLCEAQSEGSLSRGMRGLVIRMARAFNRANRRCGAVWADRYHARILRTPREVRAALVYVLANWRHHGGERFPMKCIDPCSSAIWFNAFFESTLPPSAHMPPPVAPAKTWLLVFGYQRHRGKISVDEGPIPWRRASRNSVDAFDRGSSTSPKRPCDSAVRQIGASC